MDIVSVIVWLSIAAIPLAVLPGWLAGAGNRPLATLVMGRDAWRRSEAAWPHGVQEDDQVTWQFREAGQTLGEDRPPDPTDPSDRLAPALDVEPVRPTVRVRSRQPSR
jgi:hypothetical protein